MDEILRSFYNDLRRYGVILEDKSRDDSTGSYRVTTYLYDGVKFFVAMFNGEVISIT